MVRWRPRWRLCLAVFLGVVVVASSTVVQADQFSNDNTAVWDLTGNTVVRALATNGSTVYVGGDFDGIQDPQGPAASQRWLLAVDAASGAHQPTFAPSLNGVVWDLKMSDDHSTLYVAGEFTTVNGVGHRGVVALDPVTGATQAGFAASTNNHVYDLALSGGDLYLTGKFSRINGELHEKMGRVNAQTGVVDSAWAPFADAADGYAIDVDPLLERAYVGGFFPGVDGLPNTEFMVAISTVDGAVVTSFDPSPVGGVYDILARPGHVYAATGGPGGHLELFDTVTGARTASYDGDGDLQVLIEAGQDIFVGGHHLTGLAGSPFSPVQRIDGITDAVDVSFGPSITSVIGTGIWALETTETDLWVGGAITDASPSGAIGLARYPLTSSDPVDVSAPSVPLNLTVDAVSDLTVGLSWDASTDNSGAIDYIVDRDGVALGAVSGTSFIDTTVTPTTSYTYTVRAVDVWGNVSADGVSVATTTLGPLSEITAISFGAPWAFLDTGIAPPADWRTTGFDDSAWATGNAELGRGDGDEATTLVDRDVTYLRHSFSLGADQAVAAATFDYLRDDGVVVSVNGTEVLRDNVPDGPIGPNTTASSYVFGGQESQLLETAVDPSLFVIGENVVAVSLHDAPGSGDASFNAQLTMRVGSLGQDTTAPTAPTALTVTEVTEGSVRVTWGAATDNVAVTGYTVFRDGNPVGSTSARVFTDGSLTADTSYTYTVAAFDAAGNTGPESAPATATTDPLPNGEVVLVGAGTTWNILDSGSAPVADWKTRLVAPSSWSSGQTEIGVGDGGETTVIAVRPVVFVSTVFDIGDPTAVGALTLDLLADDGAVAYINGVEVVRDNVGPGVVDQNTAALTYRWTVASETVPISWNVPAGLLVSGPNVLAISIHNAPSSTDMSFDAALTAVYQAGPDSEAPSAPANLVITSVSQASAAFDWAPSFDNVAVAGYRVQRDGVEVADVQGPSFADSGLQPSTTYNYTVTAYDVAGNVSAPSPILAITTDGAITDLVPANATWTYLDSGVDPGSQWAAPSFDDSGWPSGVAELGAGDGDETTTIVNRPVVWFRTSFAVTDTSALAGAQVHLVADDGAAVYLNGVEVARDNLPPGPLTATTPASSYRWSVADETASRTFTVPVSTLVDGTNVLAVRVHNGLGSSDLSFSARLEVQEGENPDETAPTAPGAPALDALSATEVTFSWAPATDDVGVVQYEVWRDAQFLFAVTNLTATDTDLSPSTAFSYTVRAVDAAGNTGPMSAPLDIVTDDPPPTPDELVALDAAWRYLDTGAEPEPAWEAVGYDDSSWSVGAAQLGRGEGDESTVVANNTVTWLRHSFDVIDPSVYQALTLSLLADDGAVVLVNGVEVLRDNVGPGVVDASTAPLVTRWGNEETAVRTFSIDPALLVAGSNVLAISLHNVPGSADISFVAGLVGQQN